MAFKQWSYEKAKNLAKITWQKITSDNMPYIPVGGFIYFWKERKESEEALKKFNTEDPASKITITDGVLEAKLDEAIGDILATADIQGKTEEEIKIAGKATVNRCANAAFTISSEHFENRQEAQRIYDRTHGKWAWTKHFGAQLLYASALIELILPVKGLWSGIGYLTEKAGQVAHWARSEEYQRNYAGDEKIFVDAKLADDKTWYAFEDIPVDKKPGIEKLRLTVPEETKPHEADAHFEIVPDKKNSKDLAEEVKKLIGMAELSDMSAHRVTEYLKGNLNFLLDNMSNIDAKPGISEDDLREAWQRFARDGDLRALGLEYDDK